MDIPSSPCRREARPRDHENASKKIILPVGELLARLPVEYCQERREVAPGRKLEVACSELFQGNTPRLPLRVLEELLPDLVRIPEGANREERVTLPAGWLALYFDLKADFTEEEHPKQQVSAAASEPEVLTESFAEPEPPESVGEVQEISEVEKKPRFFASLPIFQRHEPPKSEEVAVLSTPEEMNRELPVPTEAAFTLERLWKLDPGDQLADPVALQSLFMTEEKLTLERVMALAGTLPGLRACVLAHGNQVVCSSAAPAGIDLQTLSAQATAMLSQIQDSASRMGLGAVPAITLHAEQGVLSFLHQGELCLLVLHTDRGFVPGVRERLQEMLGHLNAAQALPE